ISSSCAAGCALSLSDEGCDLSECGTTLVRQLRARKFAGATGGQNREAQNFQWSCKASAR
ncbi:MAG: hypothetical protein VXZ29_05895, partial [Pseudomonadota bacterium]|nr:hypothetical protein [Pseudomonadota bacterium]